MTRIPLIAGNWKMNLGREEAIALATDIAAGVHRDDVEVAIFPPALWVADAADHVIGSDVRVGVQNCSEFERGAFTGELAPSQIAEIASLVIIGHSERRQKLGETDATIRAKLDAVLLAGLTPILCVGETLEIRNRPGDYVPFVVQQIRASLADRSAEQISGIVIAYEPIWAIGTGVAATPGDAQEMSAAIRAAVDEIAAGAGARVRIQYGGSVNPSNAAELLGQPDVDGALVGGAALKAADFLAIIDAAPARD